MTSVFLCVNSVSPTGNFGPTESFRCHRNIPLGATDFATGKTICHLFYISSDPAPLNESCPLQASQFYSLLCTESQGPNLFDGFQEKPSWKLMSKGEKEITSKLKGERKYSRIPDAWCSRGEMSHALLGERHVFALSSIHLYLLALIFCSLSSPNIPCKIQGEQYT